MATLLQGRADLNLRQIRTLRQEIQNNINDLRSAIQKSQGTEQAFAIPAFRKWIQKNQTKLKFLDILQGIVQLKRNSHRHPFDVKHLIGYMDPSFVDSAQERKNLAKFINEEERRQLEQYPTRYSAILRDRPPITQNNLGTALTPTQRAYYVGLYRDKKRQENLQKKM